MRATNSNSAPSESPDRPAPAWAPLRHREFRVLWLAVFAAIVGSWMNDTAAGWLMASLTPSPLFVALVQTATTFPILLLGLPAGALADIFDRRQLLIGTQIWVALVALMLFTTTATNTLTPVLLLVLVFANGIGMALRMPALSALTPELVPRTELGPAVALNGIAMNGSRILGPVFAGLLLAWLGDEWVFLAYALTSIGVGVVIFRWQREVVASSLPSERFFGAMRLGLQFTRQTPAMLAVMVRIASVSLVVIGPIALLPLIARDLLRGTAATFTLLLASMGIGAVVGALALPRVRQYLTRDQLVGGATVLSTATAVVLSVGPSAWVAGAALCAYGLAWIAINNALAVAAQTALPDWVRARGMSVYMVCQMSGLTLGAVLWGQVAAATSLRTCLQIEAAVTILVLLATLRFKVGGRREEDLTPVSFWREVETATPIEHDQGPVLVTVEYFVDPTRAQEFSRVMARSRRLRLRSGAVYWGFFRDAADPRRFVEHYVMESWVERLRQLERVTAEDLALSNRKNEFHLGPEPPALAHFIMQPVPRR